MWPRHRSHTTRLAAAMLVSFALLAVTSCGDAGRGEQAVAIGIDLEAGQHWTAHGPAVDREVLCREGIRHVVDGIDPMTGDIVAVREWSQVIEEAVVRRNTTVITLVVENTCADGSGSFVTREQWGPGIWSIESGTGAYRELRGSGELSFATSNYMEIAPLQLHLDGVLER